VRTATRYRLIDVLVAVVTALGWRPVSGEVGADLVSLTFRRQPLRDRSDEHDLSGPGDNG